jgi:hypothetical protein
VFQRILDFSGSNPAELSRRLQAGPDFALWRIDYGGYDDIFDRELLSCTISVMENAGLVVIHENRTQTVIVPNFPLHRDLMQLRYGESYIDLIPQGGLLTELEMRYMLCAGLRPYHLLQEGLYDIGEDSGVSAFGTLLYDRVHQILRSSLDPQNRKITLYLDSLIFSRMSDASDVRSLLTCFLPDPIHNLPIPWEDREKEIRRCLLRLSCEFLEADFRYSKFLDENSHKRRAIPYEKKEALPFGRILESVIGLFETSFLDYEKPDRIAKVLVTHILFHDLVTNQKKWEDELQINLDDIIWPSISGGYNRFQRLLKKARE